MGKVLIDMPSLADRIEDPNLVVVDCRFSLADPGAGRQKYLEGHLPGAIYTHLDEDLSGPLTEGSGRHPLPDPGVLANRLGELGIGDSSGVVVYDDMGGAIAARLWWLLRWLGHEPVRMLDGGFKGWTDRGLPLERGSVTLAPLTFTANPQPGMVATAADAALAGSRGQLFDARAPERFRGETEPIDKVAGHIPGAQSMPFKRGLDAEGYMRSPFTLKNHFEGVAENETDPATVYCGSGVTAAHLALAMEHAGLPMPRLYVGSWSEWITDSQRPLATGP